MIEVVLGIALFTIIVVMLSGIILLARSQLVATGSADIVVNDERTLHVSLGGKLLTALADSGLYLPAGCGGKGTCGQCRLHVTRGGGQILPTETSLLSPREEREHVRLACQVSVRENMVVRIAEDVFGVRRWECTVRSNRNVATFIKELVLELPRDEDIEFRAGGYIQVECPPYHASFRDFDVDPQYRDEWDRHKLWELVGSTSEPTTRAYSMANYPDEEGVLILNVRIATPPPGASKHVPPGVVSSYLFSLKPDDRVTVAGPYGEFFAKDTDKEMVFIGGGAGMAPLRSLIFDQLKRLKSQRRISFWYGARSKREVFYKDEFDQLEREYGNFDWHIALSEPEPEDRWTGPTGFIHQVVYDGYLKEHPSPEDCEYYICGPPLMNAAVIKMLEDLGVGHEDILLDDFGG